MAHALLIIWGYAVTAHTDLIVRRPRPLLMQLSGRADGHRRRAAARRRRRRLGARRAPPDALRDLVLPALLHLPGGRAGVQPPVRDRRRLHDEPAARVAVVARCTSASARRSSGTGSSTPVRQALRHRLRVAAVHPEGPGVVSIVITGRHLDELRAESGQFFRWRFLTRDLWWASNPYSLSAAPAPTVLRITVKDLGEHSAALRRLRPGTRVLRRGSVRRDDRRAGDAAARCCSSPAASASRRCARCSRRCPASPATSRCSTAADGRRTSCSATNSTAIAQQRGARLHVLTGHRAELGHDPLSAAALTATSPTCVDHDVYVCGPDRHDARAVVARAAGRAGAAAPDPPRVVRVLSDRHVTRDPACDASSSRCSAQSPAWCAAGFKTHTTSTARASPAAISTPDRDAGTAPVDRHAHRSTGRHVESSARRPRRRRAAANEDRHRRRRRHPVRAGAGADHRDQRQGHQRRRRSTTRTTTRATSRSTATRSRS